MSITRFGGCIMKNPTAIHDVSATAAIPMQLEPMEPRRLLSAAINGHGVLYIQGTSGDDTITVFLKKGDPSKIVARVNNTFSEFDRSDVTRSIGLIGGAGNDRMAAWDDNGAIGLRVSMFGGNGRDIMHGHSGVDVMMGENDRDVMFGEAGDDSLMGGNNDDVLHGGDGADVLKGGLGRDRIMGDEGQDDLDGEAGDDSVFGGGGNDDFSRDDHTNELEDHRATDDGSNHNRHGFDDDHKDSEFEDDVHRGHDNDVES
jgi:Ca2+-binding RTX toxin-like protein